MAGQESREVLTSVTQLSDELSRETGNQKKIMKILGKLANSMFDFNQNPDTLLIVNFQTQEVWVSLAYGMRFSLHAIDTVLRFSPNSILREVITSEADRQPPKQKPKPIGSAATPGLSLHGLSLGPAGAPEANTSQGPIIPPPGLTWNNSNINAGQSGPNHHCSTSLPVQSGSSHLSNGTPAQSNLCQASGSKGPAYKQKGRKGNRNLEGNWRSKDTSLGQENGVSPPHSQSQSQTPPKEVTQQSQPQSHSGLSGQDQQLSPDIMDNLRYLRGHGVEDIGRLPGESERSYASRLQEMRERIIQARREAGGGRGGRGGRGRRGRGAARNF